MRPQFKSHWVSNKMSPHFSVLQATKTWVGRGNKATQDVAVLSHTASDRKLGESLVVRVHKAHNNLSSVVYPYLNHGHDSADFCIIISLYKPQYIY